MKLENSKSGELDWRSIKSIVIAFSVMCTTFYITNMGAINGLLEKYVNADVVAIFSLIVIYAGKKLATDYSK